MGQVLPEVTRLTGGGPRMCELPEPPPGWHPICSAEPPPSPGACLLVCRTQQPGEPGLSAALSSPLPSGGWMRQVLPGLAQCCRGPGGEGGVQPGAGSISPAPPEGSLSGPFHGTPLVVSACVDFLPKSSSESEAPGRWAVFTALGPSGHLSTRPQRSGPSQASWSVTRSFPDQGREQGLPPDSQGRRLGGGQLGPSCLVPPSARKAVLERTEKPYPPAQG